MVTIQLVTVEGCPDARCKACAAAEATLRDVIHLCGMPLPAHKEKSHGEHYLADGRTIEAVHLDCSAGVARGFDPADAPFLLIDGDLVLHGAALDAKRLTEAVVKALFPGRLAGLRP